MIVRSIVSRHGCRALAAPAARSCHRAITTSSLSGVTPEQLAGFTEAAALSQIAEDPRGARERQPQGLKAVRKAYECFHRVKKATANIGSVVERRYVPSSLVNDPPAPKDITLELLMASQTHMGHHTSLWNPANSRYIYGVRQGIHIISLETTAAHLRRAARVVEEVAYRGGLILFVGTRKGQMEIVTKAARLARGCHLFTKWTPGSITNRDMISRGKEIKVIDEKDAKLSGFERLERTGRPLVPDLVVCLNPLENYTLLYECGLASVPTIGIIDTDANPDWVTYTIPANDDSYRSVAVIGGVLGRAGEQGQKRRLADAENGVVTWQTPVDTERYMRGEIKRYTQEIRRWERESAAEANKGPSGEQQLLETLQVERTKAVDGEIF
ncbi:ribosomal protein S2 [Colletotrichum caudatum]|nr:ribosomal protein S2 [Colletotrichum caudatum]